MSIVVFDPTEFKATFPEYSTVPDSRLSLYFTLSENILNNTDASVVPYAPTANPPIEERAELLNLLVAHLSELDGRGAGAVGRTQSGSEGSVSFSLDMSTTSSSQFFLQTQWGALYWQATLKYRSLRMVNGINGRVNYGCRYPRR